jgi:hypothetical protein
LIYCFPNVHGERAGIDSCMVSARGQQAIGGSGRQILLPGMVDYGEDSS